jgi:Holliday junction resolvase
LQKPIAPGWRDTQDPAGVYKNNGEFAGMSGRSAQAKGRRGEIELARYLQEKGFTDAQPGAPLNYGKEADITGISGLHIECKRHERLEINKWYEQAAADAERMQDGKPVVIFRQNRRQWMIALSLADFLELKGGATDGKNEH